MKTRSLKWGLEGDRVLVDAEKGTFFMPMFDRILVEPQETKERSDGGIYIPDTARIKETAGKVVAVGHGHFDDHGGYVDSDSPFNIGDTIIFAEFTGIHITLNEKRYLIIYNRDVLGVLMKEK